MDKQLTNVCLHPGQNGRFTIIAQNSKVRMSRYLVTWPKPSGHFEDPVVPLERNLHGHPLAGLLWERQFERSFLRTWMEEDSELGMYVRSSETRLFISFYVGDIKNGWKEAEYGFMRKKLMKNVDLDEPPSFLDHVYLGCTQRECKTEWNSKRAAQEDV